jgi:hypothetical protein
LGDFYTFMILSGSNESLHEDFMAKSRHLPLLPDDLLLREGISPLEIEEGTTVADGVSSSLVAMDSDSSEDVQSVPGERRLGDGTNGCDQETRTWNPRFMSMNYALARTSGQ